MMLCRIAWDEQQPWLVSISAAVQSFAQNEGSAVYFSYIQGGGWGWWCRECRRKVVYKLVHKFSLLVGFPDSRVLIDWNGRSVEKGRRATSG